MAADKYLIAVAPTAAATGTLEFASLLPRPARENAFGQTTTDGPSEAVALAGYSRAGLVVECDGGKATFVVEVNIGGAWALLETLGEVDDTAVAFSFSDLAFAELRISWNGSDGPDIKVGLALGC